MEIKRFIDDTSALLSRVYPQREAGAITYRLADHFFGINRHEAVLYPHREVDVAAAQKGVEELLNGRPVQYVVGHEWFCDMKFSVGESVLIPRPETEELVRWIARENGSRAAVASGGASGLRILDIGTGSGAIAVSLAALLPLSQVGAVDISSEALTVAAENATENGVKVNFMLCNILKESPEGKWDIIVSNPPYVTEGEKAAMRRNVIGYEPHIALFAPGSDPLLFYRAIARYAGSHLSEGGKLYFEINENSGSKVAEILTRHGFSDVELRKDIFDKERMVGACLKFIR